MRLTLFDLDNTLLAGDSDLEWAQFLVGRGVLDREVHETRNRAFYEQYQAGTLDIHAFLDFQLGPLARHPRALLDAWRAQFMREKILPIVTSKARELVARHLREADLVAIVTATNSFVTAPIAREFGVAHLIATEPEQEDGEFTGRVSGLPCFREGKVARLEPPGGRRPGRHAQGARRAAGLAGHLAEMSGPVFAAPPRGGDRAEVSLRRWRRVALERLRRAHPTRRRSRSARRTPRQ